MACHVHMTRTPLDFVKSAMDGKREMNDCEIYNSFLITLITFASVYDRLDLI